MKRISTAIIALLFFIGIFSCVETTGYAESMNELTYSNLNESGVRLQWGRIESADYYTLVRYINDDSSQVDELCRTSNLLFDDRTIEVGKKYNYVVTAYDEDDNSIYEFKLYNVIQYPTAVSMVSVTNRNLTNTITWKETSDSDGYEVFRRDNISKTYVSIGTSTINHFTDTVKIPGRRYYYYIKSYVNVNNSKVYSGNSRTAKIMVRLPKNSIQSYDRTYASKITLTWSKTNNATGYQVYRATSKNGKYKRISNTSKMTYSDKNISPKKTYYYKIRAYKKIDGKVFCYSEFSTIRIVRSKVKSKIKEKRTIVDSTKKKYSYNEMRSDINRLAKKYSKYMTYSVAGTTADGRNIYLIKLGNQKAKKKILVQSTIHAREYMNSILTMSQLEYYLQNWNCMFDSTQTYGDTFDNVCVYIMPMLNPDGVTISQYGIRGIRSAKLRAKLANMPGIDNPTRWKSNARGVDLNRNFGAFWSKRGYPSADFYSGPYANSERETKTIEKLIKRNSVKYVLSYHSTGTDVFWNVGQTGKIYRETKKLATTVANYIGYPLGEQSVPEGLSYNWTIYNMNIPELIIETGYMRCPAPISEFKSIWNSNKNLVAYMCSLE